MNREEVVGHEVDRLGVGVILGFLGEAVHRTGKVPGAPNS